MVVLSAEVCITPSGWSSLCNRTPLKPKTIPGVNQLSVGGSGLRPMNLGSSMQVIDRQPHLVPEVDALKGTQ
jgi:hypothetical protein